MSLREVAPSSLLRCHSFEEIFIFAQNHFFYRARFQGLTLVSAPTTTKSQLAESIQLALSRAKQPTELSCVQKTTEETKQQEQGSVENFRKEFLLNTYWSRSSGTTSCHLFFFPTDIQENLFMRQVFWQRIVFPSPSLGESFLKPETIAANLFFGSGGHRTVEIFTSLCEFAGVTVIPLASLCNDETIEEVVSTFSVNTLIGLPNRLIRFASYLLNKKEENPNTCIPQLNRIIYAGEPMYPHEKKFLTQVFGVTNFNGFYGSSETGVWGYQPDWMFSALSKPPHSLRAEEIMKCYIYYSDMMHVEIIPASDETSEKGVGKIVVTNLIRTRHPAFRYEIGDQGKLLGPLHVEKDQDDEFVKRLQVLMLRGKELDTIYNGDDYFDLASLQPIISKYSIIAYQIVVSGILHAQPIKLEFRLVKEDCGDCVQTHTVLNDIVELLPGNFDLEVKFVRENDLERMPLSQKLKKIIDKRIKVTNHVN